MVSSLRWTFKIFQLNNMTHTRPLHTNTRSQYNNNNNNITYIMLYCYNITCVRYANSLCCPAFLKRFIKPCVYTCFNKYDVHFVQRLLVLLQMDHLVIINCSQWKLPRVTIHNEPQLFVNIILYCHC